MNLKTPLHHEYLDLIREICGKEETAFRWFQQVLEAALLWDHLVDEDHMDIAAAEVTLTALTTEWIHNDWYYRNRNSLTPVLVNCLSAWKYANATTPTAAKSYDLYTELACTMTLLCRGQAGVEKYMPQIRAMMERERREDLRRDHPPFLIVGLPRSRTAWLAAFLTGGEVHCHHELLRQCKQWIDYPQKLLATPAPIVGDADPTLPLFYEGLREQIGPHKVVFIEREEKAAEAAHLKMLQDVGQEAEQLQLGWPRVVQAFRRMKELCPDARRYDYEDLDDMETMRELTEHCTGMAFDEARWRLFDELKVTALPAKVVRNLEAIK